MEFVYVNILSLYIFKIESNFCCQNENEYFVLIHIRWAKNGIYFCSKQSPRYIQLTVVSLCPPNIWHFCTVFFIIQSYYTIFEIFSKTLENVTLILTSNLKIFWGLSSSNSQTQTLLSFSKILKNRELDWEFTRFEVSLMHSAQCVYTESCIYGKNPYNLPWGPYYKF